VSIAIAMGKILLSLTALVAAASAAHPQHAFEKIKTRDADALYIPDFHDIGTVNHYRAAAKQLKARQASYNYTSPYLNSNTQRELT
jgi:hypothetical protein